MIIRPALYSDLKCIAVVHKECFQGTFISYWGKSLIEKYYKEFYEEKPLFVVAEEGDEVVGFCMGYQSGSKAKKNFIRKNFIQLASRMIVLCLSFNCLVIKKCFSLFPFKHDNRSISNEVQMPSADLLSICVKDPYKGRGVAKNLIDAFESLLLKNGLPDYSLSVYKNNVRAIRFYEKMGFYVIQETADEFKMYKQLFTGE